MEATLMALSQRTRYFRFCVLFSKSQKLKSMNFFFFFLSVIKSLQRWQMLKQTREWSVTLISSSCKNLIFNFIINSSKLGWFCERHRLTHCVACNTIPLKDKHLKTASRMVTLCQLECGNAIKSQLRTERSICMSFSGSCLIPGTRLVSLRLDWSFADFTVGRERNSWNTASYTNILTWT